MAYYITFKQRGNVLAKYEYEAAGADELKALIEQAHDQFRKDFPDTSLFDGVTVHYDKSSTGSANNRVILKWAFEPAGPTSRPAPAKFKADRAAREEAEAVIERWNWRLATGRDMLWSPTMAALLAGTPWLDVFCPGCGTSRAIDLRTLDVIRWRQSGRSCSACGAPGIRGRRRCRNC